MLIYFVVFITSAIGKLHDTAINTIQFSYNRAVFVTKYSFDKGQASLELKTKLTSTESVNIQFGILSETQWKNQINTKCFSNTLKHFELQSKQTITKYEFQLQQPHTYYFAFKDCASSLKNFDSTLQVSLLLYNNGSHLSTQQDTWYIFPIIIVVSFWLGFKSNQDNNVGDADFDWARFILMSGILSNLAGLFWKSVGLLVYNWLGKPYLIFELFYLVMRGFSQTIMLSLIILISLGWTINFLNDGKLDIYLPIIFGFGLVNIVVTLLNVINQGEHDKYHMYDSLPGNLVVGFRFIILLVYIVGMLMTYRETNDKARPFVIKFGICGLLYVMALPILITLTERFVQLQKRRQYLFILIEIFQLSSNILLTYMVTSKKSTYAKICYKNMSFLPSTQKFF